MQYAEREGARSGAPASRSWFTWMGVVLAALAGIGALVAAELVHGTFTFTAEYEGRLLPRSVVEGVDVSGMTEAEALAAVKEEIRPELSREVTVAWKGKEWDVTPKELGASSNARAGVQAALGASEATSFFDRMRMRWLDHSLNVNENVAVHYPEQQAQHLLEQISSKVELKPVNASLDYSTGWVNITPDRAGRKVLTDRTHNDLMQALKGRGKGVVPLAVKPLQPETTEAAFEDVLLVRIGENRLYHYENGEIAHSYTVATGLPEFPTPTGLWEVTELRYMPTWINPDPTGWGSSLPAEIPPGPSNPLGTRAINWSAPAIRFHGTLATDTLGYNASHGCVRMSMPDVEQLFEEVDVGTPIVSLDVAAPRPLYTSSAPDPTPVPN
jgi:lipoprotein-anchoring transpeptidase ErfK/SrfK